MPSLPEPAALEATVLLEPEPELTAPREWHPLQPTAEREAAVVGPGGTQ